MNLIKKKTALANHHDESKEDQQEYRRKQEPPPEHAQKMTLDMLKPGKKARILTVDGEKALRRHLLDMGLTPNTLVMVRKVAPLGDPIELYLRNFELTLRKEDAGHIGIEEVAE